MNDAINNGIVILMRGLEQKLIIIKNKEIKSYTNSKKKKRRNVYNYQDERIPNDIY